MRITETRENRSSAEPRRASLFKPPDWSWLRFGEIGWWVIRDWVEPLLGPDGLRLEEWKSEGRLETVKSGEFRIVHRVDLPRGPVFVKHFLAPGLRAKVRQWIRRGKARNESKRARSLERIGVPTIEPIALGEQRRRGFLFENYLVTLAVEGALPLDAIVERSLKAPEEEASIARRIELVRELGRLTARLHNAGFLHHDFHPGNLLARIDEDGKLFLTLIDLDALRIKKRLKYRDVVENLALLNHYFWVRCSRSDRRRFLRTYLDERVGGPTDVDRLARDIERSTRAWAERLWTRWAKRGRGGNKYFEVLRSFRAKAVAARNLEIGFARRLVEDPEAPFRDPANRVIKDSRTTTVIEVDAEVGGIRRPLIYKRFNVRAWYEPILNLFRPARGLRAWQAGRHMASRGVPAPRDLMYLEQKWAGGIPSLPSVTYLLTIKAVPAMTLTDFLLNDFQRLGPDERRRVLRSLAEALGRLLRLLHDRSLSHRDLKGSNVLIEGDPLDRNVPRVSLIDLVGVSKIHPLPRNRRVQNLARLGLSVWETPGLSRSVALRFLKHYLPFSAAIAGYGNRSGPRPRSRSLECANGTPAAAGPWPELGLTDPRFSEIPSLLARRSPFEAWKSCAIVVNFGSDLRPADIIWSRRSWLVWPTPGVRPSSREATRSCPSSTPRRSATFPRPYERSAREKRSALGRAQVARTGGAVELGRVRRDERQSDRCLFAQRRRRLSFLPEVSPPGPAGSASFFHCRWRFENDLYVCWREARRGLEARGCARDHARLGSRSAALAGRGDRRVF